MMRRGLVLLVLVVAVWRVSAQDPQFSQYYQSPLYLNPGFTGITPQQRATFNHRIQWPNLPQAFSTFAASYDIWVDELKSGFGILATTDKIVIDADLVAVKQTSSGCSPTCRPHLVGCGQDAKATFQLIYPNVIGSSKC